MLVQHLTILEYIHEAEIAVALSVGGWIMLFPVRTLIAKVKSEWEAKTKMLQDVHTELITQRTNCLATLQKQGETQIEVLKETAGTLKEMHNVQLEMVGFMKGSRR